MTSTYKIIHGDCIVAMKKKKQEKREYDKKRRERLKDKLKELRIKNKDRIKEWNKSWIDRNKDYHSDWEQTNKIERRKQKKQYYIDNKEDKQRYRKGYLPRRREIDKKRRKEDPLFRLRENYSGAFTSYFKRQGTTKQGKSCMSFISYTIQELRDHLESLFLPGMSWDNYGSKGWVIDHIIPSIFFNAFDQVELKMCWRLENLQPMWEKDNLEKNDGMIVWGKEINARHYCKIAEARIKYWKNKGEEKRRTNRHFCRRE